MFKNAIVQQQEIRFQNNLSNDYTNNLSINTVFISLSCMFLGQPTQSFSQSKEFKMSEVNKTDSRHILIINAKADLTYFLYNGIVK